jgi:MFS family permease
MMNSRKPILFAVIAAFSGFLFGFDMVVISGADQTLQSLWHSSDLFHGWVVMSMALWGTVIGSIFGHIPTDLLGRKKTLLGIGVLFAFSALGSAFANDPYTFAFARFLGGIGIGISTVAAPAYIAEISPADQRGRLVGLYQFNIVFGILTAYLSNFYFSKFGTDAWRWMLGIQIVPAFLFSLLTLRLEESTRMSADPLTSTEQIYDPKYRRILWLTFFIAFFNQFSGINAFLYYAPRIFELAQLSEDAAALSSIGVGLVNLVFTMLGLLMIDRFGRKTLLTIGGIGYVISLGLITFYFSGIWVSMFFFLFIAAHAVGQGAVIWVLISELYPDHLRAKGQAFGSTTHWILAAIIPALMPYLFEKIGAAAVFGFFTFMMVIQLFWIRINVTETKGKTLHQIHEELQHHA